jgi:hypothetical protein
LDYALCVLEHQPEHLTSNKVSAVAVALDTRSPEVGDWIHVVALTDFIFDGVSPKGDGEGTWQVKTRPVVRVGKVLSREASALGHSGPCFRTSVPVDKGMSGGFAYIPRDDQPVAACGIISSGPEEDHKQSSFLMSGNSVFGGIMGTLGLKLPPEICGGAPVCLLDLLKRGHISDVSGSANNIEIINARPDGSYQIIRKPIESA